MCAALLALAWAAPATAQDWIRTVEDWSAFQFVEAGRRVCYASTTPIDMEPKNVTRGEVSMQVTHDGRDGSRGVVSIFAGYTFAESSTAVAAVGPAEFRMFTDGSAAWNPTPEQDRAMVEAMISGTRMTVSGLSDRGTDTRDNYSLLGFTAVHGAIDEACGD
jgi:hypothetical protein